MKWRPLSLAGFLTLLLLSASVLASPGPRGRQSRAKAAHKESGQKAAVHPATTDPSYIISPGDVLKVSVWMQPQLTETVPVRPDGRISLPLLHDMRAAGRTPMELGTIVAKRLRRYLHDPQVTVIVTQVNGQLIYILGKVKRAGEYPLMPGMTVLQALSSAGGFTEFANRSKIIVLRTDHGKQIQFHFDYPAVISGRKASENILLKPGDNIIVP